MWCNTQQIIQTSESRFTNNLNFHIHWHIITCSKVYDSHKYVNMYTHTNAAQTNNFSIQPVVEHATIYIHLKYRQNKIGHAT